MKPVFCVRGLSYRYRALPWTRAREALRDVHLEGQAGEVHALVGANGAGKSTLLKHLAGLLPPRQKVEVFAQPAGHPQARARVAFLPEATQASSRLRVGEVVDLQAALYHVPRGDRAERVHTCLQQVGLSDLSQRRLDSLSLGQRRRVELAQVLVPSASLLLLDEPFSGVDPLWVENLCQLLRSQAQSGTSVLLSSHSLAEVEQVCDRVTLLEQGEVVLSGAAAEVLAEPQTFEIHVRLAADSAVDAQTLEEALRSRFEGVQVQVRPRRRSLAALLRDRRPGRTPH